MNGTLRDEASIEAMQKRLDEEMASGSVPVARRGEKSTEATYRKDVEKMHRLDAAGATGLDSAYSDFLSELGVVAEASLVAWKRAKTHDRKIFVGRLPHSATAEELMERFKDFGSVENVACIPDVAMGYSCKGFCVHLPKTRPPRGQRGPVRATERVDVR